MKSILVFVDGTICDDRHRLGLYGTADFNKRENLLKDLPVDGSVDFLKLLTSEYNLIYLSARSESERALTEEWLQLNDFPSGELFLGETLSERMKICEDFLKNRKIIWGIGDRWDDNQLHLMLGCKSIIVREYGGDWQFVLDNTDIINKSEE